MSAEIRPIKTPAEETIAKVKALLKDAVETPELALFGRMIADNPDWNVEAACQVAHALSTHRVTMDFDFFTALVVEAFHAVLEGFDAVEVKAVVL